MDSWLDLVEFSTKYSVSVSTLRRRIKDKSLEFQVFGGKYYVRDEEGVRFTKKSKEQSHEPNENQGSLVGEEASGGEEIVDSAPMIDELKKVYTQALQEKETQIFQLKEEVSDLKTLVRVLEAELKRVTNSFPTEHDPIDLENEIEFEDLIDCESPC